MQEAVKTQMRAILRTEITDFLVTLTTPDDIRWPAVPDQELIDALADSLVAMGKQRGMGTALLQTLVHELQDRVNFSLN